jgi:hypothetical protein
MGKKVEQSQAGPARGCKLVSCLFQRVLAELTEQRQKASMLAHHELLMGVHRSSEDKAEFPLQLDYGGTNPPGFGAQGPGLCKIYARAYPLRLKRNPATKGR